MLRPPRTLAAALACAALLGPALARAADGLHRKVVSSRNLALPGAPFRDSVVGPRRLAALALRAGSDGVYTTADGATVRVVVSADYPPDPAADQALVDLLGSLLHGDELSALTVDVGSPADVGAICGGDAAGCYEPSGSTIVVPGQDLGGALVEQILAHEYGHHVAAHRDNAPWNGYLRGTKRWASRLDVCRLAAAGRLFPGAEAGARYRLNPGEGFAEAYRFLSAIRAGTWAPLAWNVVDPLFEPGPVALGLIEQDVLRPWLGPTSRVLRGSLAAGRARTWTVETPDDGVLVARVDPATGARVALLGTGGRALSRPGPSATLTVCGRRRVVVAVSARRAGPVAVALSVP